MEKIIVEPLTKDQRLIRNEIRQKSRRVSIAGVACWHCKKIKPKMERHHPTYDSPSFVVLCRACHAAEHRRLYSKSNTKRKNKPGAGRPKKLLEPTVPIRVPKSMTSWIKENLDKVRQMMDS